MPRDKVRTSNWTLNSNDRIWGGILCEITGGKMLFQETRHRHSASQINENYNLDLRSNRTNLFVLLMDNLALYTYDRCFITSIREQSRLTVSEVKLAGTGQWRRGATF